ncbi:beta-ketoacyl synthase N-terminal-like domain-containing protein [Actinoallomurus sp. CA-142502]|uniref:beta-ketoacyl synthase N-terminal-like domain-containing protein n=1 Tax=Actinoallomurus sp. CA-142502 TaxID=3239885 RepID=UPI003D946D75
MNDPVAVVGLGCVFPDAPDPAALWRNLLAGKRSITRATAADLGADPAVFLASEPTPDRTYCLNGGYVRQRDFNLDGYRLPADRIAGFDPSGLWTLDAARQALAGLGHLDESSRRRCGLVLGCLAFPTQASVAALGPVYEQGLAAALADVLDVPALRPAERTRIGRLEGSMLGADLVESVCAALGLGGPRLVLDAACASSLYAIKLGCDLLAAGRCDLALAGGVSGSHRLLIHVAFSTFQAYPRDGVSSLPLDGSSQGLLAGEGAGVIALKRLRDAERDGDEIHAVIRAIGMSNDGAGRHPLAPNPATQRTALERAYAAARIDPATVDYVECHATGTPLGDLTELNTIERVFGARVPLVGAVKSNVGHLLTAAGMAGTLKVILAMRAGVIPATAGLRTPLVSDGGAVGPERIVGAAREWPTGAGPRRASVNAFGFGGANAHLVVDAAPDGASLSGRPPVRPRPADVAVVGLAGLLGDRRELPAGRWRGLDDDELLRAHGFAGDPPPGRYLDAVVVDALRFKAPPGAADVPVAQQMMVLDVADRALRDSGVEPGTTVAVVVAMAGDPTLHRFVARLEAGRRLPHLLARAGLAAEPDELATLIAAARDALHEELGVNRYLSYIGNIMATRVAGLWDLRGPAFTVTAAGSGGLREARAAAEGMLARGEVDAAVVAAVDLAGAPEVVLATGPAGEPVDCAAALVVVPAGGPADPRGRRYELPDGLDDCRALAAYAVAHQREVAVMPRVATRIATGGPRLRESLAAAGLPRPRRAPGVSGARPAPAAPPPQAATGPGHEDFLRARQAGRIAPAGGRGRREGGPRAAGVVWDRQDLLEFARGDAAAVFGPEFAEIDQHRRRVRLPMPPYLLVDRVTRLDATPNVLGPSALTTEYDVPRAAWYAVDGQVPWSVTIESGQCDLLLISYLGVDFGNRGERVYRLLDCTLTFLGRLPREGDTLRYDIHIDSFARTADTLLFFFHYDCFAGERKIMEMRGGCAGFFTDEELAQGKGVLGGRSRVDLGRARFEPPLRTDRVTLDAADLDRLSDGALAAVFGPEYDQGGRNPALRLAPSRIRMLDRIVRLDPAGGPRGLGEIVGEKDLRPDDWYFPCHFLGDPVLAGSLMAEGCVQLLQTHLLALGLQTLVEDATFEPVVGVPQRVRCRGQVTPADRLLTYRARLVEVELEPNPYAKADVDVVLDGRVIVAFEGLAVRLAGTPVRASRALFGPRELAEFATGSMTACFGPEYDCYAERRVPRIPNGDLHLMSRVVSIDGTRHDFRTGTELLAEYDVPARPWFDPDGGRDSLPYSMLMEIALQPCGFLSGWLGSTLATPDEDLYFRNLDGDARLLADPALAGRTVWTRARLCASTALEGVIIQKFDFVLGCADVPIYRGSTAFGYFRRDALANQIGLDGGRRKPAWSTGTAAPFDPAGSRLPMPDGQLDLLDEVTVALDGGTRRRGCAWGRTKVDPSSWFFDAHFFQDPVMPGSLGVEALLQALKAYTAAAGLGARFARPRFAQAVEHRTVWKYRGQIVRTDREMLVEVHVTEVRDEDDRVVVIGDGDLWKDGLRIYHVAGLAVAVVEAGA